MLFHIRTALRSVLAILAGIGALSLIAFAVEIPLRTLVLSLWADRFPDQAVLDSSTGWLLSQSLYTVPALIFGGYVTAWLAPCCKLAHSVAMAIVQEGLILLLMLAPPHPVPPWMWGLTLVVTPPAILIGGYWYSVQQHHRNGQRVAQKAAST